MTSKGTHEEWLVLVAHRYKPEVLHNARMWWTEVKSLSDRYCKSEAEAKMVLAHAYKLWNGAKQYKDGKREEVMDTIKGLGNVTMVSTPKVDRDLEIVKHVIKRRIVTEWETVEEE